MLLQPVLSPLDHNSCWWKNVLAFLEQEGTRVHGGEWKSTALRKLFVFPTEATYGLKLIYHL